MMTVQTLFALVLLLTIVSGDDSLSEVTAQTADVAPTMKRTRRKTMSTNKTRPRHLQGGKGKGKGCTDYGCGCGHPGPGPCGCDRSIEDLGCGCGHPGPGPCGCDRSIEDLGCGCGHPGPGPCGCDRSIEDKGCGCGHPGPGPCGCDRSIEDKGCGCGNPGPGHCGCHPCPEPQCGPWDRHIWLYYNDDYCLSYDYHDHWVEIAYCRKDSSKQKWYFDDGAIKVYKDSDLCLAYKTSGHSRKWLYVDHCDGGHNQMWEYKDHKIRAANRDYKCADVCRDCGNYVYLEKCESSRDKDQTFVVGDCFYW